MESFSKIVSDIFGIKDRHVRNREISDYIVRYEQSIAGLIELFLEKTPEDSNYGTILQKINELEYKNAYLDFILRDKIDPETLKAIDPQDQDVLDRIKEEKYNPTLTEHYMAQADDEFNADPRITDPLAQRKDPDVVSTKEIKAPEGIKMSLVTVSPPENS